MAARSPKRTEASVLTERLRAEIVSGVVAPGARLKLVPLARRFEVSRGPLREAASRLAAEGLLTIEDQRGFRVKSVSRADLLDVTATRKHIEGLALRASLTHGDVAWEGDVLAAAHVLDRVSSPGTDPEAQAAFRARHADFHRALVAACPSVYLLEFRDHLYRLTERYRNLALQGPQSPGPARDVAAEHASLAQAAVARDGDAACALLDAHLERTAQTLLRAYPDLFGPPEPA
jgi:DNA-binding GntR family transcriptional regulator